MTTRKTDARRRSLSLLRRELERTARAIRQINCLNSNNRLIPAGPPSLWAGEGQPRESRHI